MFSNRLVQAIISILPESKKPSKEIKDKNAEAKNKSPDAKEAALSSSSTAWTLSVLNGKAEDGGVLPAAELVEVMPKWWFAKNGRDVDPIIIDYLGGDLELNWHGPKADEPEDKTKPFSDKERRRVRLMGRCVRDLMNHPKATKVANLGLSGEAEEIDEAEEIIRADPSVMHYRVLAHDRLDRHALGRPFEIMLIGGDIDIKPDLKEIKHRGAAERFALAGNLTKQQIEEQDQVLKSVEARDADELRSSRSINIMKKFGKDILAVRPKDVEFAKFQGTHCKKLINDLEADLLRDAKEEVVMVGKIIDGPLIIGKVMTWFDENDKDFNLNQDWVFGIDGYGTLQFILSARDGHVARPGIGRFVDLGEMPARTLKNSDGSSHFFRPASKLGRDFYIGYYDTDRWRPLGGFALAVAWNSYVKQKQQRCKTYATSDQLETESVSNTPTRF